MGSQGNYPLNSVRMLALTKYGRLGASSRMRTLQYLPWLKQASIDVNAQPLFTDQMLQERYARGAYGLGAVLGTYAQRINAMRQRARFDIVWIEKEALPWAPVWLELGLLSNVPFVLDYDDAIFHNYDLHRQDLVRRTFGRRLDRLMSRASLVVGGNSYLAQRAEDAGADWVEVLPTTVDLERYPVSDCTSAQPRAMPRVVWIGSPSTVRYLQVISEPLRELASRQPFVLRVIGGRAPDLPGVTVEELPWSEAIEVQAMADCDVGVMPLLDSPWERGKCGYKLIQYMACGLPVVASRVGANCSIVRDGESGYLAETPQEWLLSLERLLADRDLRSRMGLVGRRLVEESYSLQVCAPVLSQWLHKVATH
jgi:glycosyltransferase involved in cell wall biosynthesis